MKTAYAVLALIVCVVLGRFDLHGQAPTEDARATKLRKVLENAHAQVGTTVLYDPAYVDLKYPGGDVPADRGVCTDVVIRAFRAVGIDLQQLVHEDMKAHFSAYPKNWGLSRPDTNIDHRRVPNLMTFFTRQGKSLPVTANASDYQPGDVVTWSIPGGVPHIGLVVTETSSEDPARHLMIHNIGAGAKMEDVLFGFKVIGHYRPL